MIVIVYYHIILHYSIFNSILLYYILCATQHPTSPSRSSRPVDQERWDDHTKKEVKMDNRRPNMEIWRPTMGLRRPEMGPRSPIWGGLGGPAGVQRIRRRSASGPKSLN